MRGLHLGLITRMSRLRRLVTSDRWSFIACRVLPRCRHLSDSKFAILAQVIAERRAEHRFLTAWAFLPDSLAYHHISAAFPDKASFSWADPHVGWYDVFMSRDTETLLDAFEHLPVEEKRAFTQEVLRRSLPLDSGLLEDEEIGAASAALFESLEEEDGHPSPR